MQGCGPSPASLGATRGSNDQNDIRRSGSCGPDGRAAAASRANRSGASHATGAGKKDAKTKKEPSAGMLAMRERQKKCGAEWKTDKAAGKVAAGMKWPQYWSACNKRLKGGA